MDRRTMLTALTLLLGDAASPPKLIEGALRIGAEPENPQRVEKQFRVGPGKKLSLQLRTGGSVDIAGWDENTVSVKLYSTQVRTAIIAAKKFFATLPGEAT